MFSGNARWLLVAGLASSAVLACSSDSPSDEGGGAGMASGGSAAGNQTGGTSSTAGSSNVAGSQSGSGQAGSSSAGTGGAAGGTGGAAGGASSGSGGGGTGGASGGASGAGGSGGGAAMPTAVANIMGLNGKTVTGTATFTQGATMTKLVINLTACPNGMHASHLHETKDCGNNGDAAGGHWMPNGINFGDYTCADNKVTYEIMRPTSQWTVGAPDATDVTKYAFMVHEGPDTAPGMRIGCGVVNKQ